MAVLEIIILVLSIFFIGATLAPLLHHAHWLIRGWDFPRLQVASALLMLLGASVVLHPFVEVWHYFLNIALALCLIGQLMQILPYTLVWKKQVKDCEAPTKENTLSMISANVYAPNRNVTALLNLVKEKKPHLLLTLESNLWWEEQLKPLETAYPHTVKVPLDNLYGMHLYSKLPFKKAAVKFLVERSIPSIHACVVLPSGQEVLVHCLHPKPPSPTESSTSTPRDIELLLVGQDVDTDKGPVVVLGDLNDVAWSRTTRQFQKISGLLDPRRGRGFYNTFHAKYRLMRWPLDHVFHSNHFTLLNIERLPNIGSDHFPMCIVLHLELNARTEQEEPEANAEEEREATEKIENGVDG